jgi:trehalose 6-phosphate phosphatase
VNDQELDTQQVNLGQEAKLGEFFRALAEAQTSFLFLDYDGTLAPFRVDRFKARPWTGVRELLAQIQRQGRTRMQVITGRPAHEIAPLLGLEPPLEVWGLHGAERLYADGRRELEEAPAETHAKLEELRDHLRHDSLGGLFEDKANGVVMHWRGETPQKARLIEQRTRALFEPAAQMEGLMLLNFEAGLELRAGRDKGGAVKAILEEACIPRSPNVGDLGPPGFLGPAAFLGDDLTDESAFAVVNGLEGAHLSVLVRVELRTTVADAWLRPPKGVLGFLKKWVEAASRR